MKSMKKEFKKYLGSGVSNLKEFCTKYYRHDRFLGRGKLYADAVIKSHKESIEQHGYTIISHHDSVTGEIVSYYQ